MNISARSAATHIIALAAGATIAGLIQERRVRHREHDTAYKMLSRSGVEARLNGLKGAVDVIFIDMDDFKGCNAKHGEPEVNRRMQRIFARDIRVRDLLFTGRWQSGDEILVVTPAGQGRAAATRLQLRMAEEGLMATFGVVRSVDSNRLKSIEQAYAMVHEQKNADCKGGIHG